MQNVSGRAAVADTTAESATLIAAITDKTIFVQQVHVAITTASSGGTGIVTLRDGSASGTIIWQASAAATATWNIQLSSNPAFGYPLTSGNALTLAVSGATTEATGFAIATGVAQ